MNPEHQLQSKKSIILFRKMCPQKASTNIGGRHHLPQDLKKKGGKKMSNRKYKGEKLPS